MNLIKAEETAGDASGHPRSGRTELAFVLPGTSTLRIMRPQDDNDLDAFLAHQVARVPHDLRTHVQRIVFHLAGTNAVGSYGALVDLFIALGPKGIPLRQRMLDATKHLLDRSQYQALVHKLDPGLHAADPLPAARTSMLSKGTRGIRILVERLDRHETPSLHDPLDQARSYLEYGQLDEARSLLENALLDEPLRVELHTELLEIYGATLDLESFSRMWKLQDPARNPAADAWRETAELISMRVIASHSPEDPSSTQTSGRPALD